MLEISGPFNIQLLCKDDFLKVIECNLRASRSFPFVSKTKGVDMISIATQIMLGRNPVIPPEKKVDLVGVKVAQFSFNRLGGSDPTLSVDMMSTGEVACYGRTKEEAFLKAIQASGTKIPKHTIFLSFGGIESKQELLPAVKTLVALGYTLSGSIGTADFYASQGIPVHAVSFPSAVAKEQLTDAFIELIAGKYELVIDIPMRNKVRRPIGTLTNGYYLRRVAIDRGISLITDIKCARMFVEGLRTVPRGPIVSEVDCQSSWDSVNWPVTVAGPIAASEDKLHGVLASTVAAGYTTALVLSKLPINESVTNVPADYATVYGGEVPDDLSTVARLFGAIFLDTEHDAHLGTAGAIAKVLKQWPRNKPVIVQASGHTFATLVACLHASPCAGWPPWCCRRCCTTATSTLSASSTLRIWRPLTRPSSRVFRCRAPCQSSCWRQTPAQPASSSTTLPPSTPSTLVRVAAARSCWPSPVQAATRARKRLRCRCQSC